MAVSVFDALLDVRHGQGLKKSKEKQKFEFSLVYAIAHCKFIQNIYFLFSLIPHCRQRWLRIAKPNTKFNKKKLKMCCLFTFS